jgi:hypothetical protein
MNTPKTKEEIVDFRHKTIPLRDGKFVLAWDKRCNDCHVPNAHKPTKEYCFAEVPNITYDNENAINILVSDISSHLHDRNHWYLSDAENDTGRKWLGGLLEKALTLHEQAVKERVVEMLMPWLEHDNQCILCQFEKGEPTENGGYRQKFAGKWYESKPVDRTPECNCELNNAITKIQEA